MKKEKKHAGFLKIFIIIAIVIAAIIFASVFFYKNGTASVSDKEEEVIVRIEPGMGALQMLDELDQAGLIKNKMCAKVFLKLNHFDHLQANTYILNKTMSVSDIFNILQNPEEKYVVRVKLTIKDGNTIPQLAKEVAGLLEISEDEVIKTWSDPEYLKGLIDEYWFLDESILNKDIMFPLEGYLYPETYYVTEKDPTVQDVTKYGLDMMDKKLSKYKEDIQKMGWTPHEFLSFASVVERESLFDKDRPVIAGVFMNRLNDGMRLQSDITVNYAWQRTGVDVSYDHLKIDSKYNTYLYSGLPVGPISTVLDTTMEDCIHYEKHDYMYFFAKEDGTVIYSKTLEEHNKAIKENKWY